MDGTNVYKQTEWYHCEEIQINKLHIMQLSKNLMPEGTLGSNFLTCTIKDKKDLIFNGVFFCPIFWFPSILMNQNMSNYL
jgi:hypothetical protein